jgi:hypothetical protein
MDSSNQLQAQINNQYYYILYQNLISERGQLIIDKISIENQLKKETKKYNDLVATTKNNKQKILEIDSIIAEKDLEIKKKEEEIKVLKEKNLKHLIENGSFTQRNNILTIEKKKLLEQITDLQKKYDELNKSFIDLQEKYMKSVEELEIKQNDDEEFEKILKDSQINFDENTVLKSKLAENQGIIAELHKILINSNDIIHRLTEEKNTNLRKLQYFQQQLNAS